MSLVSVFLMTGFVMMDDNKSFNNHNDSNNNLEQNILDDYYESTTIIETPKNEPLQFNNGLKLHENIEMSKVRYSYNLSNNKRGTRAGEFIVEGHTNYIHWEDGAQIWDAESFPQMPIQWAEVQLKRIFRDGDEMVWWDSIYTFTNNNGYFQFSVDSENPYSDPDIVMYIKIYVRSLTTSDSNALAEGGVINVCSVFTEAIGDETYEIRSEEILYTGFTQLDVGTLINNHQDTNCAFHIHDVISDAYSWVRDNTNPSWTRPRIHVDYPSGDIPRFEPTFDKISIPKNPNNHYFHGWDDDVIQHEYGHAVMHSAYEGDEYRPLFPPEINHLYDETDEDFAVIEGWAEFFDAAVDNNARDIYEHFADIERNHWEKHEDSFATTGDPNQDFDGHKVLGCVASIWWDIFDDSNALDISQYDETSGSMIDTSDGIDVSGANDKWTSENLNEDEPELEDEFNYGFDEIFNVLQHEEPYNIRDFWDGWFARGNDDPNNYFHEHWMKAIYFNHGVRMSDYLENYPYIVDDLQIEPPDIDYYHETIILKVKGGDADTEDQDYLRMRFQYSEDDGVSWHDIAELTTSSGEWIEYLWDTTDPEIGAPDGEIKVRGILDDDMRETYSSEVAITIDNTNPITISTLTGTLGNNGWYVSSVSVILAANDRISGVEDTYYRLDGDSWETYSSPLLITSEGIHSIEYYSIDRAGNIESTHSVEINIDKTSPSIPVVTWEGHEEGDSSNDNCPIFTWTEPSDLSGIAGYSYILDTEKYTLPDDISESAETSTQYFDLDDGTYYFHIKAVDNAGNWGYPQIEDEWYFEIIIDRDSPEAPIVSSPTHLEDVWECDNDPVFTWTEPYDPNGIEGYSYAIDLSPIYNPDTTIDTISRTVSYKDIGDGDWYFHVRAIDIAGNPGDTGSYNFRIDDEKPVSEATPLPSYTSSLSFDVHFTSSDSGGSGINFIELWYSVDTGSGFGIWKKNTGTYTSSPIPFTAPYEGTYKFYTIAYDIAGNIEDGPIWMGHETDVYDNLRTVAWGDMNNDNSPELAVGGDDDGVHVYLNYNGDLENIPIWSTPMSSIRSIKWCDINNDGFQDISIVGQAGGTYRVQVFLNNNGMPESTISSQIFDSNLITSIAWGDIDNDGDLDLLTGGDYENKYYKNNGGIIDNVPYWTSGDSDYTSSIVVGDIDNDGDLDLVAGNIGKNKVYYNVNGDFISYVYIDTSSSTLDIALGDVNNDGFLDLVEGNNGYNNLFINIGGSLEHSPSWISEDSLITCAVAFEDINMDGKIDLITGDDYTYVYLNTGTSLETIPSWNTVDLSLRVNDVALNDVDNDGHHILEECQTGDGIKKLFYLNNNPIISIISVEVNGVTLSLTDYCADFEAGWIAFKDTPPDGQGNIQISYRYSRDLEIATVCENGIIDSYYSMVYDYWPTTRTADTTTIVDITPPGTPVISSPTHPVQTSWYSNNDPNLQWTLPYDLNGISGFSFILDKALGSIPDNILNCDDTITEKAYTDKSDDIWYFHIKALDNTGIWGETSHYTIKIDVEAPSEPIVSSSHPEDTWTSDYTVYLEWNGPFDDLSGIDAYSYTFNDVPDTVPDEVPEDNPLQYTYYHDVDNQIWYFHIMAVDNAGNWGATRHYIVKVDCIPPPAPTISSSSHPDESTWYINNDPVFLWIEPSDLSGIDGYCIILNQDPNYPLSSIPDYYSTTYSENDVEDGVWYFHVRAIDNAGNPGFIDTFQVKIDTTSPPSPIISSTTHEENVWTSNVDPEFEWTVPDDASGIAGYSYELDQTSITIPDTDSEGTATTKTYNNVADGEWWFHVRAYDNSGKWGDSDHYKIKIDITDPVIIIGPEVALVTDTSAIIEWATDELCDSYLEYATESGTPIGFIEDSAFVTDHSLTIEGLSLDQEYLYYVESKDQAGNSVHSNYISFTIKMIDTYWYPDTSDPSYELVFNLFIFPSDGGFDIFYVKVPKTGKILSVDFALAPDMGFPELPLNPKIDIGNDGVTEWSWVGDLDVSMLVHCDKYNYPEIIQGFQNYIDDPNNVPDSEGLIYVPIKLSSDSESGLYFINFKILYIYQYIWATYTEPNPDPLRQDCLSVSVRILYTGSGGLDINFITGSEYRIMSTIADENWIKPATIKQHYADINNDGLIDGTTIPESTLKMYWYDDATQSWLEAGDVFGWENTGVNTEMNYVWTNVDHFSNFTAKGSYIPIAETETLIRTLNDMDIPFGIKNSLRVKLEATLDYLNIALNHYINEDFHSGNENMTLARNYLTDFINEVRVLKGNLLREEDAELLMDRAVEIIALIDEAYVD
jgi:hypothetical protein